MSNNNSTLLKGRPLRSVLNVNSYFLIKTLLDPIITAGTMITTDISQLWKMGEKKKGSQALDARINV